MGSTETSIDHVAVDSVPIETWYLCIYSKALGAIPWLSMACFRRLPLDGLAGWLAVVGGQTVPDDAAFRSILIIIRLAIWSYEFKSSP